MEKPTKRNSALLNHLFHYFWDSPGTIFGKGLPDSVKVIVITVFRGGGLSSRYVWGHSS